MSDNTLGFTLDMNIDPAMSKAGLLQETVERLQTRWNTVKTTITTETRQVLRTISSVISVFKNAISMLGITLDPVQEAILATIEATISTIIAINAALAAGSGGVLTPIAVAFAVAGLAIATAANVQAALGMEDAKRQMGQSANMMNSIENMLTSFSRL